MNVEEFKQYEINRREFLNSSAKNAAGMAAGVVGLGAVAKAATSERVRVGVVGVRNQGKVLAKSLAEVSDVDVMALCDVDESQLPIAAQAVRDVQGTTPRGETDFRRLLDDRSLDAVVVATPDHWHALMTIMACQAGKDVYVEKPVSHTFAEGQAMVAAARRYRRVVQSGLQQRSGAHFPSAVALVQSGELGRVRFAKAWTVHRRKPIGQRHDAPAPASVDYGMWLGPAPERPFNPNRFHHNWHWFWDYGTGELGNWGVHMLDVARWGLGVELPTRVAAAGGRFHVRADQEIPDTLSVDYAFGSATITWEHRLWSSHGLEGRSAAAAFYGDEGTLVVDRGGWKVYDRKDALTADASELARTHHRNFIDCIKTRAQPNADIEIGHVSSAICHLGNIAYRLGRDVTFDPDRMDFGDDDAANALCRHEYRHPWKLPAVS